MADNYDQLFGDYTPQQDKSFTKTPLQAFKEIYPTIQYQKVCEDGTPCKSYNPKVIPEVVNNTDLLFVALGTGIVFFSLNYSLNTVVKLIISLINYISKLKIKKCKFKSILITKTDF